MALKEFPLAKVYSLLESGPVIMITTAHNERVNVMPMSWHMMIDFDPPLVGFVMSDRNYSFELLKAAGECVICIPTLEIAEKVVGCGNTSGAKTDKFAEFGLTRMPAAMVGAPLIEDCRVNLECRVLDTSLVPRFDLFVVEVVKAWINPALENSRTIHHLGKDDFMVAGEKIKIGSKMK